MFVCGNGHSHAGSADQDAEPGDALLNVFADAVREHRVVTAGFAVGSDVNDLVAQLLEVVDDLPLQPVTGMVGADGNGFRICHGDILVFC